MDYRWLPAVLFLMTNMIPPIHLSSVTEPMELRYPAFTGCKDTFYCKKKMKASGSFNCVIRDVNPDVRLVVATNSTELKIYFQKESIITTDGVSNITLQTNFSSESELSACNSEIMVSCKAMVSTNQPNIQIGSTALLGILVACQGEKPLSMEEKVWLAAITLFPFLWIFTLVIVCCLNKKYIFKGCRDRSQCRSESIPQNWLKNTRGMTLTIRPKLVEDIDAHSKEQNMAYVYFIDDHSCYAVPVKAPHKSIKLILERKNSRAIAHTDSEQERTSMLEEEKMELSVLETMHDSSVQDNLVQDNSVQDSSTPEKTNMQQQSTVTNTSLMDSVTDLERRASTPSTETLQNNLEWCRCGKCQERPENSKVCCRRTYGDCVTDDPLFYQLVTDRNTLQAAMIQWNDDQVASRFEAMAYKEYIFWQVGVTQSYSRVIIPSCVVKKVQSRYPKDSYGQLQRFLSLKL